MRFFSDRAERREIRLQAGVARTQLDELRREVVEATRSVVTRFGDLPGFPSVCSRCGVVMVYERLPLGRAKWRWMWRCPRCGQTIYDAQVRKREVSRLG